MPLRGVKPAKIQKRLKLFLYGPPNSGKTFASIQFPRPYLIDCERGAENDEYVDLLNASGGAYFATADFDEMVAEVAELLNTKHLFKTLIIDPLTVVYNDLCHRAADKLAAISSDPNEDGTSYGRHKAKADRKLKQLLNLLLRLDMNVIVTSHAKTKWEKVGSQFKEAGVTFDCYAKLDYLFDLVIELQQRGKERVGIVRKTRLKEFPGGDIIKPFSYGEIAERDGREILERDAIAEALATPEQFAELTRLINLLKIENSTVAKWLAKANANTLADMPATLAGKCISFLEFKIQKGDRNEIHAQK